MKGKVISAIWLLVLLSIFAVTPVAAQEEASFVFVPGWVAWVIVVVSLVVPIALFIYLRDRGHL